MEPDNTVQHTLDKSKDCIQKAVLLMEKMTALRALLLIKKGSGQRYLQHTNPTQDQLKKAEQNIQTEFMTQKKTTKKRSKSSLVQTISRKGMA